MVAVGHSLCCAAIHSSRLADDVCCMCPPSPESEFKVDPGATLHLWTTDKDAWTTLTAHSNPDGTYR